MCFIDTRVICYDQLALTGLPKQVSLSVKLGKMFYHSIVECMFSEAKFPLKLSRGEICVAKFIPPCKWGESG